jgi:hypothetical protein
VHTPRRHKNNQTQPSVKNATNLSCHNSRYLQLIDEFFQPRNSGIRTRQYPGIWGLKKAGIPNPGIAIPNPHDPNATRFPSD